MAENQCQIVDRLEGVEKNKVINMCPKYVCLTKSLKVNFLSSSEKEKLHIKYLLPIVGIVWYGNHDLSSSETFCFSSAICGFIISGWLVTLRISLGDLGPDHLLQLSIYKQPYRNN